MERPIDNPVPQVDTRISRKRFLDYSLASMGFGIGAALLAGCDSIAIRGVSTLTPVDPTRVPISPTARSTEIPVVVSPTVVPVSQAEAPVATCIGDHSWAVVDEVLKRRNYQGLLDHSQAELAAFNQEACPPTPRPEPTAAAPKPQILDGSLTDFMQTRLVDFGGIVPLSEGLKKRGVSYKVEQLKDFKRGRVVPTDGDGLNSRSIPYLDPDKDNRDWGGKQYLPLEAGAKVEWRNEVRTDDSAQGMDILWIARYTEFGILDDGSKTRKEWVFNAFSITRGEKVERFIQQIG